MDKVLNIPHSCPWIIDDDISIVNKTLLSGMIAYGELVKQFESLCQKYLGQLYVQSASTGQAALFKALQVLDLPENCEIVMPSYVCCAVEKAVRDAGALPLFCDVGDDWCISEETVAACISSNTAAIIVVHPFGIKANVLGLKKFGLPIIEDCCQCFSSNVGLEGDLAVFSFHATKCLTTGEGGLVATTKLAIKERLVNQNISDPNEQRLSDLQAALGISQLARYDQMLAKRKAMSEVYFKNLSPLYTNRLRAVSDRSLFFRFVISTDGNFDDLKKRFWEFGIHVRKGVDQLLHLKNSKTHADLLMTDKLFNTTLSIPFYPALKENEIDHILFSAAEVLP